MPYLGNVPSSFNVGTDNINNDAITTAKIADGAILNADVNAAAAIAGTKISPDFGSQNILTTGTATAASLIPTSSTVPTNGLYLPAANSVAISTGGSGRLFINSAGNVGIGAANTGAAFLEVGGSLRWQTQGIFRNSTNTSTLLRFAEIGSRDVRLDTWDGTDFNGTIRHGAQTYLVETGTGASLTERLRITSAGLVGIGTSSPQHPLHVIGGSSTNNNGANAIAVTGTEHVRLKINTPTTGGYQASLVLSSDEVLSGTSKEVVISTAGSSEMRFATSGSERMRLDSSGRLGIGSTSPSARLHVIGDASSLPLVLDSSAANSNSIQFRVSTNVKGYIGPAGNLGGSDNDMGYRVESGNNQVFYIGANERARLDSSGRWLLGTSSTSSPHLIQTGASGAANAASLGGLTIGNSNGEYPSAGYNIKFTSTSASYQYNGTDYAVMIRYGQNSGRIETFTAPSGTGGNTISFTAGPYVANNGGSWTSTSDERLKTDLEPISNGLSKVATLRAVTGRYKTDSQDKRRSFLIAQDVQAVLPEAVDASDSDNLGLSYTEVVPLLVAALKESKERIEQLEAKVAALESA